MLNIEISQKDNDQNGVFKAKNENGRIIAQMSYFWSEGDKMIIDHTEVAPDYEGMGIGKQLVYQAVEFARAHHVKILPMCPFAKAIFARNKDIDDCLA